MNLRKEKAARIKVQVLEHTLKLIGKKSFEDLYIDALCDKVKISKVTLFKYFPQKEDILLYYFRIWCLYRSVELATKPKEGLQGIYYVFDKMAEAYENYPGLMLSLLGYLSNYKRSPKPFPVKAEEKKLLFPHVPSVTTIEILSLEQMLEKFILEAIFRKEITKTTSTQDIANLFTTVFMGGIVTARLRQLSPVKMFFRKNVDGVMRGLV
ncbi:TetR/AcrR family transcriptional regulator [Chryseolinea sp. H1M3-3]|uniref:TetR/AcrR family transcriptional regulator n=1 Tax=Chryseolinea sp. H1M3-3 TaxID=3034144 RepID=UPI0023ECADE7|nr:TetR/AcrR family transcriptional regulator [Chryseolinea sp. H1M3-3]